MARYLTAEEVQKEHLAALGKELGPLFDALYNEVQWLHVRWSQHRLLYGTNRGRIDLLNEAAPLFFRLLQTTLFEQTLLDISRLTDPAVMGKRRNLTLQRLADALPEGELKTATMTRLKDALDRSAFARDWRNRRIVHMDLELALKKGVRPLSSASRAKVDAALEAIAAVMNGVSAHYLESETAFGGLGVPGDATQLIYVMRDGLRAEREARQRMSEGRPTDADLNPGPPI